MSYETQCKMFSFGGYNMNFKRKLWWAQHRNEVYKYGTILSLVLVVTISIIYFTYSKFSSTNEVTAYETTVEPFIKNDYFIASYIDGEWSDSIPGKDDGYVVDKIVCDNGATATWNNEEWGINVRNETQKIKCNIYFVVKPLSAAEKITTLATTDTTNFATDDPDNNIRYIGADPSNYVYFNCSDYLNQNDSTCEKWRIIGVFKNMTKKDGTKEDLVKIIRNDFIWNIAWDDNSVNDWSIATLQTTLNGDYYNGTYETGAFKNDLTRNAIESIVWNLGGPEEEEYDSSSNGLASHWYGYERGTTVYDGNPTTWTGKIGLMYPSDYGYATSGNSTTNRAACLAKELYNWYTDEWENAEDCYSNDYLHSYSYDQWTLVPTSSVSNNSFLVNANGDVSDYYVNYGSENGENSSARPVAFLKSSISISSLGDGTSSSPYQLKVG